jgi:hypothetical protein
MEELDIVGTTFGTEKSSSRHDYLRHYGSLFARFRREQFNFIEIGVFNHASLATWRSYFENANIVGVDSQNHGSHKAEDGIVVEVGSRDDPGFLFDLTHAIRRASSVMMARIARTMCSSRSRRCFQRFSLADTTLWKASSHFRRHLGNSDLPARRRSTRLTTSSI